MFDKRRIRKNGLTAQALVLSAAEHPTFGSSSYQNYDFVLEVRPESGAPFQARLREKFYIIESKPKEADLLQVKYDPKTLQVVFDLEGDPRYDVEAMQRRTARMQWEIHNRRAQGTPMPPGAFTAPAAPPGQGPVGERIQALERLARLRQDGAISAAEFEALKADLMKGTA